MTAQNIKKLTDPRLALLLAYAPAGLGHLRVTRALRLGLPPSAIPVLLPDPAESVRTFHRLMSVNPLGKNLMEWSQHGWQETLLTRVGRKILNMDAHVLERKLVDVLKQRMDLPHTLLVVSTHFSIGHQVGTIKYHLAKKANIRVILVVQVTDDSPQKMWYVPHADLITVPSEYTKQALEAYGREERLPKVPFVVSPYPISPELLSPLSSHTRILKNAQASTHSETAIHVSIPISGAAVGMPYAGTLMSELHRRSKRFHFQVVAKRTLFTELILRSWDRRSYVSVYESHSDRQIVELYEQSFEQTSLLLEITKPSEQAFKALLRPSRRGGVILLFSEPVGRQEYDNLNFLRRHRLIPSADEQQTLYTLSAQPNGDTLHDMLREEALHWRGLTLPNDPHKAAAFILWCQQHGLFTEMLQCKATSRANRAFHNEVSPDGTAQFWHHVCELL